MDFGGGDQIRFEQANAVGILTLTRPQALNALTHQMVTALSAALHAWESDASIKLVVVKGEGRAFCAGGDILDVYRAGPGKASPQFFADEYRLNAYINRYPKPYVSIIDGIVMGGGVGISCHGSHRVMTERAQLAMPEVGIGFFPDVGGSHLLPDLGSHFGMYLALTGNRIGYGDAMWSGLVNYAMKSEYVGGLLERLIETGEPDLALREVFTNPHRETDPATLGAIARHFAQPSLHKILRSLQEAAPTDEFASKTLATINSRSPTSLAVTFRQITSGLTKSMDDCMRMEFRILNRMLAGHDFYEGIRAALVDKDGTPRWKPARLENVTAAMVDAYFAPLPDGDLTL